jgi:hypothetical protein
VAQQHERAPLCPKLHHPTQIKDIRVTDRCQELDPLVIVFPLLGRHQGDLLEDLGGIFLMILSLTGSRGLSYLRRFSSSLRLLWRFGPPWATFRLSLTASWSRSIFTDDDGRSKRGKNAIAASGPVRSCPQLPLQMIIPGRSCRPFFGTLLSRWTGRPSWLPVLWRLSPAF